MRKLTVEEVQKRVDEALAFNGSKAKIKVVGKYEGATVPIAMKCSVHGKFKKVVSEMRVQKNYLVCAECSRDAVNAARIAARKTEYLKELKEIFNGTIQLVGDYVDLKTKAWHLCTVCGHKANVIPASKVQGHGCSVCAHVKKQEVRGRVVTVKGISHKVEGYEGRALVYMTNALRLKSKDILSFATGKVPSISYTHTDKTNERKVYTHFYHPDFYVKKTNTFYEVKSTMTLGLFVPEVYAKNRSKAKGCVAQGYDHVLVLVLRDGETVALENWYKKSRKSLIKYLHEECLVRSLA